MKQPIYEFGPYLYATPGDVLSEERLPGVPQFTSRGIGCAALDGAVRGTASIGGGVGGAAEALVGMFTGEAPAASPAIAPTVDALSLAEANQLDAMLFMQQMPSSPALA